MRNQRNVCNSCGWRIQNTSTYIYWGHITLCEQNVNHLITMFFVCVCERCICVCCRSSWTPHFFSRSLQYSFSPFAVIVHKASSVCRRLGYGSHSTSIVFYSNSVSTQCIHEKTDKHVLHIHSIHSVYIIHHTQIHRGKAHSTSNTHRVKRSQWILSFDTYRDRKRERDKERDTRRLKWWLAGGLNVNTQFSRACISVVNRFHLCYALSSYRKIFLLRGVFSVIGKHTVLCTYCFYLFMLSNR